MMSLIYIFSILITAEAKKIDFTVCQDEKTFPPFHYSETHIKKTGKYGIVKTKLNAASKDLDLKVKYIKLPWKRCAVLFRNGKADALMAAIWSKNRKDWGVFPKDKKGNIDASKKILTASYSIFTHRDSKVSWDGKQVHNLTNGLFSPKGYVVTKILKDLGVLHRYTSDPTQIINVVARKRVDGFVSTNRVANYFIKKKNLEGVIKKLDNPILVDDWHIPVSHAFYKKHPKLVQAFWDNLKQLN